MNHDLMIYDLGAEDLQALFSGMVTVAGPLFLVVVLCILLASWLAAAPKEIPTQTPREPLTEGQERLKAKKFP